MKQLLLLAMLLVTTVTTAAAEPMAETDIPVRYPSLEIGYDVNSDGSYTTTSKVATVILKESSLESHKESSVTFRTSIAKGDILEAYTLKKSGKRIDAPKSSYQLATNDGYNNGAPLYSDETTISVIFPDLAVGDTTVFAYRVTNSEGMFPGHFSTNHSFSRFAAYDDVSIRITAPSAMKLRQESYFLTSLPPVTRDGKLLLEWQFRNKTPEKWTPAESGITLVGDEPSLYVSSFDSYQQIAAAYGSRATPKAAVTERIAELATQIASGDKTPEQQARSIYNWVARNITYGGNCIGVGAVVPRDLDVVLNNRMGDCKDHATLLQALLAARSIESEQALINAGGLYDLPKVPVVAAVNHVINYLPALNLYLDSTASSVPFGMLPTALGEKPVLLVSHFREGQKTPSGAQYGHEQVMRTTIRVNGDGSATGTTRISLKGLPAIAARGGMRQLRGDQEEYVVRRLLEGQGVHGTGTLQKDDPTELNDVYTYGVTFALEDLVLSASTTGMPIKPVVSSFMPIEDFFRGIYEPLPKKATVCSGGRSVEEYVYEFPESLTLVGFPKDFQFSGPILDYSATYRKSGNTLSIRRELRDKTASSICTPGYAADYRKNGRSILRDTKSQVLISN